MLLPLLLSKWWPLVLLAEPDSATTFIWQQGHQQAPGRLPAQKMSPDLGPLSQLPGPIPMIRS